MLTCSGVRATAVPRTIAAVVEWLVNETGILAAGSSAASELVTEYSPLAN